MAETSIFYPEPPMELQYAWMNQELVIQLDNIIMPQLHRPKSVERPLAAFIDIAHEWELAEREQAELLGVTLEMLHTWQNPPWIDLPWGVIDRIGDIFVIHRTLDRLFISANARNEWLRQPDTLPEIPGKTLLDVMAGADNRWLQKVRELLTERINGC